MKKYTNKTNLILLIIVALFTFVAIKVKENTNILTTSASTVENLSSKKIEWGIKRADNHVQPDLGSVNKRIIDEANRNCNGK